MIGDFSQEKKVIKNQLKAGQKESQNSQRANIVFQTIANLVEAITF